MTHRSIDKVLSEHTQDWMSIPGVVGTGIGQRDDRPCIRIMVTRTTPEIEDRIPVEVEGWAVEIVETGRFRAR
ncbi:MAG: hypothetical protein JSU87_09150 [Gemmatimonadota bacterium]|nr:MAG: hypothetical protein JSU87_09150 [Gemmatimonadota bacterium]